MGNRGLCTTTTLSLCHPSYEKRVMINFFRNSHVVFILAMVFKYLMIALIIGRTYLVIKVEQTSSEGEAVLSCVYAVLGFL